MNRIRQITSLSLLQNWSPCIRPTSSLQAAGYAKKARDEGAGDTAMQKLLKALEHREVEKVHMSAEDLAEAERRYALASHRRGNSFRDFGNAEHVEQV